MSSEVITLALPAKPAFASVTRAGVAALGSRLGWADGNIASLHDAIDAAVRTYASPKTTTAERVTLRLSVIDTGPHQRSVRSEISHDGDAIPEADREALHTLLSGLVDEVQSDLGGTAVAFTCNPPT